MFGLLLYAPFFQKEAKDRCNPIQPLFLQGVSTLFRFQFLCKKCVVAKGTKKTVVFCLPGLQVGYEFEEEVIYHTGRT